MVEWCVGEHHAELVRVGGNERKLLSRRCEHDRTSRRGQQCLRLPRQLNDLPRRLDCWHHHGKRLLLPVFAIAQSFDGSVVMRIAGEVIAAEAFHGDDSTFAQQLRGSLYAGCAATHGFVSGKQIILRPTRRTCDRLGVEPAVGRIAVLPGAECVKRPLLHRGVVPVVGKASDDRVARAAVCAVDVRVEVSRVLWIEQLLQTFVAHRQVRRDSRDRLFTTRALADFKVAQTFRSGVVDFNLRDVRSRWRRGLQILHERRKPVFRSLEKNLNALFTVRDPTCESARASKPVDEGPEAHALYHSANFDRACVHAAQLPVNPR